MTHAMRLRDRSLEIMDVSGEAWISAVRRAAEELRIGAASWLVGSGGSGNWIWLTDFPEGGTAVDIHGGTGDTGSAFLAFFSDVVIIESDPTWLRFLERRFQEGPSSRPRLLRGGWEQLDTVGRPISCISITFPAFLPDRATRQALQACYEALRPGGRIRVVPQWDELIGSPYRILFKRAQSLRRWRRLLAETGFRVPSGFYVDPSHHDPRLIIPMTRGATQAVERQNLRGSSSGTIRRLFAWSGVHWPLYPQCFFLAKR